MGMGIEVKEATRMVMGIETEMETGIGLGMGMEMGMEVEMGMARGGTPRSRSAGCGGAVLGATVLRRTEGDVGTGDDVPPVSALLHRRLPLARAPHHPAYRRVV